jgi:hypothetical protein
MGRWCREISVGCTCAECMAILMASVYRQRQGTAKILCVAVAKMAGSVTYNGGKIGS